MDIIILNDLFIEIVDNSSIETKNKVLGSGKIRKYRLNGTIKNYDIFVEMENENVFHVKKRGIMMRVRLAEELRQLIINMMVNYVADGGDVDAKSKSSSSIVDTWDSDEGGGSRTRISQRNRSGGGGGGSGGGGRGLGCFGCFKFHPD